MYVEPTIKQKDLKEGHIYQTTYFNKPIVKFFVKETNDDEAWIKCIKPIEYETNIVPKYWNNLCLFQDIQTGLKKIHLLKKAHDFDDSGEKQTEFTFINVFNVCNNDYKLSQEKEKFPTPKYLGVEELEIGETYYIASGMCHSSFVILDKNTVDGNTIYNVKMCYNNEECKLYATQNYSTQFGRGGWLT